MSVTYLERPTYTMAAVDELLRLPAGTSQRWIDGYERRGRFYLPVVREKSTGSETVTWGEFVETRLLAGYRDAGVPMLRLRPIVEDLRQRFQVRYPLATVRPYVDEERRVVYEVQERAGLEESMRLVVEAGTGQYVLAPPAAAFAQQAEFADADGDVDVVVRLRPLGPRRDVILDPLRRSGSPVVRAVPTEIIGELVRAHEPIEWVAQQYELTVSQVLDALEYERQREAI